MKILSADDKVENLYMLEAMLRGAGCGYEVVSAHNGAEALQKLEQEKFDLIISDILMPQMDGFELCRQVKQRQDLRHIPFIFYTATYTEKKDMELGLRLGASRFIIKPLEPGDFLAILRGVIQEYEAGRLEAAPPPAEREEVLFEAYNQRLVHKLDRKVQQLQRALEEKEAELAERRKAEAQIRLQAAALEAAANTVIITDREGVIQWVNAAFERLTGYSPAEAIGQTPRLLKSSRQPPGFFKGMWDTILSGQVWQGELVNKRKDGSLYHEEMTVTPVRGASGQLTHYIAIKQDISERKQAEQAVRQLSGRLLQLQDEERRRIGSELHDTTAQELATVAMDLGRVQERIAGRDVTAEALLSDSQALVAECSRKVRTLSYQLHPPLLDEVGLASAVQDYAQGFMKRSGLQVTLDLSPALARLTPDIERALFRVVQESLGNVHRHSGSPTVQVRIWREASRVVLQIADQGRGFAPEVRMSQDGALSKVGVGITGMRERLRQLGGRLEIESGRQGTTVRATVPCQPGPA